MGIKKFFGWCRNRFADHIYRLEEKQTIDDLQDEFIAPVKVDNCMIDMNGLFHQSAQRAFEYGEFKPQGLLKRPVKNISFIQRQNKMFADVCKNINSIVEIIRPEKRLILCVDGPAPLSKQSQQRQRRFVSALHRSENDTTFDSNCLTPGTKFMDLLTKYVDWYIRKQITENLFWSKLEVVYSNEKAVGEGEHKLISFLRKYGDKNESYCIVGADADLIMLVLASQVENFYILRESQQDFPYYFVDMKNLRKQLVELIVWKSDKHKFDPNQAIIDFVFMCFTVGNDFLPHMPAVEIVEGGIDMMLDIYRNVCQYHGHLTKPSTIFSQRFNLVATKVFLGTLGQYEKGILETKYKHRQQFFADELLEKHIDRETDLLNIDEYQADYYRKNFPEQDIELICHKYLEGMQWVLSYYTKGVPNWRWKYPYFYAPFASSLAKHIYNFILKPFNLSEPSTPFIQLLSVLPPKSSKLLPAPLADLLSTNSALSLYCPEKFTIDLSGVMEEWEGVVILPMIDFDLVKNEFEKRKHLLEPQDQRRNIRGKSFIYKRSNHAIPFKSKYGYLNSYVELVSIDL